MCNIYSDYRFALLNNITYFNNQKLHIFGLAPTQTIVFCIVWRHSDESFS